MGMIRYLSLYLCTLIFKFEIMGRSAFRKFSAYTASIHRGSGFSTMHKPKPLVMCGPSGVGKSTIVKKLLEEFGSYFGFSISHTTRQPRAGELHGKDYYFVSREEIERAIQNGEFIESAEFSDNIYGTSKKSVQDVIDSKRICILDIDVQGVKQVKMTDLKPNYVFIKPPSLNSLRDRLEQRGTETPITLTRRLSYARSEIDYGDLPGNFDLVIVNQDVDAAYLELRRFILPEIEKLQSE